MRFENALVAATTLFASTSAFMITPDMAKEAAEAPDGWNTLIFSAQQTILDVQCYDCPFFVEEKTAPDGTVSTVALNDVENVVRLEFTDHNGVLQINGGNIFPFVNISEVIVHQIRTDTGEYGIPRSLDFGVGVKEIITPPRFSRSRFGRAKPEEIRVVPIEFSVIGLNGVPVKTQSALVDLIEENGKYTIARTEIINLDPPRRPDFEHKPELDCDEDVNPTLCRVRAMVVDRLRSMFEDAQNRASSFRDWMKTHPSIHPSEVGNKGAKKPCGRPNGKGRHGMAKDQPFDFGPKHHGKHGGPDRFEHHRGPHAHHKGHKVVHVIHMIIHTFVLPAILGIAGGLAASAIGMAVGQAIASMWFKYGRGGQRGSIENAGSYEACITQDEKDGLMDGEDLPRYEENQVPKYEDAPRYDDVEGRQA